MPRLLVLFVLMNIVGFLGLSLGTFICQYHQKIMPNKLVSMLIEQCDEEKIANLRSYECTVQIVPVLTYKDGNIEDITWSREPREMK